MSTQEKNLLEKLDPIQRLYYDFDKEAKKLENYAVQKEREAMEVMYQILSDPKSYVDAEPINSDELPKQIEALRQFTKSIDVHDGCLEVAPHSSTFLTSLIHRIYFNLHGICNAIRCNENFEDILNDVVDNLIDLTEEAKAKLVALEIFTRLMNFEDLTYSPMRGKFPIPETLGIGELGWNIDKPKTSLEEWILMIGKPYRLKSINEQ